MTWTKLLFPLVVSCRNEIMTIQFLFLLNVSLMHTLLLESWIISAVSHIAALSHVWYLFISAESLIHIVFHTFNKPEDFKASSFFSLIFFWTGFTSKNIQVLIISECSAHGGIFNTSKHYREHCVLFTTQSLM